MERLNPIEHAVGAISLGVSAVKAVVNQVKGGAWAELDTPKPPEASIQYFPEEK